MTAQRDGDLQRLGKVTNGYSNYLALLAIDASLADKWRGPSDDDADDDDFKRACNLIERGKSTIAVDDGKGLLVEIGGCGSTDVWKIGDAFVMVEHYTGDDDADVEADFERSILELPTKQPKLVGPVDVESGGLALIALIEAGEKIDVAKLKKARTGAIDRPFGVALAVPPGRYQIWREELDARGAWGIINARIRIVPAGTKVAAGQPIAKLPAVPAAKPKPAANTRREVGKWDAVAAMAIADDGRVFAGENGGFGVCGWAADGTLSWQRDLAKRGKDSRYMYEVDLAMVGKDLVAHCKEGKTLHVIDPATGKDRRTIKIPGARTFAVSPDRTKLVLRTFITTTVLAYPSAKPLATFAEYCNENSIAMSPDGKWLVVNGHQVHVFDLRKLAHVTTFEPSTSPGRTCFTVDNLLVTGGSSGLVRIYDPKTGKKLRQADAAPDRRKKPTIAAIAATADHIAVGRDDGTVVVLDPKKLKITQTFDKHKITDIGATRLAVAFSADGKTLWVGAGPKGGSVGLTAYALS